MGKYHGEGVIGGKKTNGGAAKKTNIDARIAGEKKKLPVGRHPKRETNPKKGLPGTGPALGKRNGEGERRTIISSQKPSFSLRTKKTARGFLGRGEFCDIWRRGKSSARGKVYTRSSIINMGGIAVSRKGPQSETQHLG